MSLLNLNYARQKLLELHLKQYALFYVLIAALVATFVYPRPAYSEITIIQDTIPEGLSITSEINYGVVTPGSNLQPEVVIQNIGVNSVLVGGIEVRNPLSSPFEIVVEVDSCSNRELLPGQRCSLIALFSPASSGTFVNFIDVDFPELGINRQINLDGEGGAVAIEADITSTFSSIDFNIHFNIVDVRFSVDDPPYLVQTAIVNPKTATAPLDLSTIGLSPGSNSAFSLGGFCLEVSSLEPDTGCILDIFYLPLVEGSTTATIIIESNDPDESPFEIPIFAVAQLENDGVSSEVEDAAPVNGDGNNDGTPDSQQSNIASLPDLNGTYLTYVSDASKPFQDVGIVDQSTFVEDQDGVILSAGVHEFTVNNVSTDEVVEVGLLLPPGVSPSAYYVFSTTAENDIPHWYKFDLDAETGAAFMGVAKFFSPTGNTVDKNIVFLRIKNGGRGDSSNTQDDKIVVKGAINYSSQDDTGILSPLFFPLIVLLFLLRRVYR